MRARETVQVPDEAERSTPVPVVDSAPAGLSVARVLALQGTAGNHSVAALLSGTRRASISRCPGCGGTCKDGCETHPEEEEAEERDGQLRAKMAGGELEPTNTAADPAGYVIIDDESAEGAEQEGGEGEATERKGGEAAAAAGEQAESRSKRVAVGLAVEAAAPSTTIDADASGLRAKATTTVRDGAAATVPLPGTAYGLTMEESIDISVSAVKVGNTWKPQVNKLTGRFSQQIRLLPGQSEVTGPAGNTTQANYCQQVTGLTTLGNTVGNPWYMLNAVKKHEDVHAAHFGPGLKAAEPAITLSLESVSIPHVTGMKPADALIALKANGAFQVAAAGAKALWSAQDDILLAGDHAAGGPCDVAEHAVVDPMVNRICAHAKKQAWPACPNCPP